jgi:hypothetical protein
MPRSCTVCAHPRRLDIDAAIIRGESNRQVSTRHNLTESSIRRHGRHIHAELAATTEPTQSTQRVHASLVVRVRTLEAELDAAHAILNEAQELARVEKSGDTLVKAVATRAKLLALEFGVKRTAVPAVSLREQLLALPPAERRERIAEMKHRMLELEAETAGGEH